MPALLSYLTLSGVLIAGGVLSPVPEEAAILAAGAATARGGMSLGLAIVAAVVGVVVGDLVIFAFGRASGLACSRLASGSLARRLQPAPRASRRARRLMERWGLLAIVAARFVPGLRGAVFFSSGAAGTRPTMVAVVDAAAALVQVPVLLAVGGGLVRC